MIAKVNTKRIDFKNDLMSKRRLFALIGTSIFLVISAFGLTWFMSRRDGDFLMSAMLSAFVTLIACLIIIFWVVWPGKNLELSLENNVLKYDYNIVPLDKIVSWALIDHGDMLEVIINKGGVGPELAYFYAPQDELQNSGILNELYEKVPYDQDLMEVNSIHAVLRKLGLR